jgi:hypothetical protein
MVLKAMPKASSGDGAARLLTMKGGSDGAAATDLILGSPP